MINVLSIALLFSNIARYNTLSVRGTFHIRDEIMREKEKENENGIVIQSSTDYKIFVRTPFSLNTIIIARTSCEEINLNSDVFYDEYNPRNWCEPSYGYVTCMTSNPGIQQPKFMGMESNASNALNASSFDELDDYSNATKKKTRRTHKVILFGDSGASTSSRCIGAKYIYDAVRREDEVDLVIHLGDHSYADNSPDVWFEYMRDLDVFLKRGKIPILPIAGNHEYDYYYSDTTDLDNDPTLSYAAIRTNYNIVPWFTSKPSSGGECGVPYTSIFNFVKPNAIKYENPPFWYTYELIKGKVTFFAVSSEHEIDRESVQGIWLRNAIDNSLDSHNSQRIKKILLIHRPLFNLVGTGYSKGNDDIKVTNYIRDSLIDIVDKFDIIFTGHIHLYSRISIWDTIQVTIGTGGVTLDKKPKNKKLAYDVEKVIDEYGYGIIEYFENDELCFKFMSVEIGTGKQEIKDKFCIA